MRPMERLWAVLFPEGVTCMGCGRPARGEYLCPACQADMRASRLQEPLADGTHSVWRHAGAPRSLVLRLKHSGEVRAAELLGAGMVEEARAMGLGKGVIVTSVTMPRIRRQRRGIDHGRVLAERVAEGIGAAYVPLLKRRKGWRHTQAGLNRRKRLENLWDAFTCAPLDGECVLLVDDVHTTGATAYICTRALMAAGAGRVCVLTATAAPEARKEEKQA